MKHTQNQQKTVGLLRSNKKISLTTQLNLTRILLKFSCLDQCFLTFFGSRHLYLAIKKFGGILAALIGINIKEF